MVFLKYILSYLFTFICITPFSYLLGGWHFVFIAYCSIVLSTLPTLKKFRSRTPIITLGLSAGLLVVICMKLVSVYLISAYNLNSQVPLDIYKVSFVLTYAATLICLLFLNNKHILTDRFLILWLVVLFLAEGCHIYFFKLFGANIDSIISGVLEAAVLGAFVFFLQNKFLDPRTAIVFNIMQHVKKISAPVLFFFLGYCLITIVFSGIYALIGNADHLAFIPSGAKSITSYVFYSFNISSCLGDTNMVAKSALCQWITIFEIIVSLMWLTIIIAAVISYTNKSLIMRHKR